MNCFLNETISRHSIKIPWVDFRLLFDPPFQQYYLIIPLKIEQFFFNTNSSHTYIQFSPSLDALHLSAFVTCKPETIQDKAISNSIFRLFLTTSHQ